jgi:predicted GNAT family acetyltransferase
MSGNCMIITHTEVPETVRGKGIAKQLVSFALKYARKNGIEIVAECDYAKWFLSRDAAVSATERKSEKSDGDN